MDNFTFGVRLAFDIGKVRIGVAACDGFGILSSPVVTLMRQDSTLGQQLKDLRLEYEPIELFIGLPINLQGRTTASTQDAIEFARNLKAIFQIPTFLIDERLSTVSASNALRSAGIDSKSSKKIIDQQAACVILDTALGNLKQGITSGIEIEEYAK